MKTVKIGTKNLNAFGSVWSLVYYFQEFNSSLINDLSVTYSEGNIVNFANASRISYALLRCGDSMDVDFMEFLRVYATEEGFECAIKELVDYAFFEFKTESTSDNSNQGAESSMKLETAILKLSKEMHISYSELNMITLREFFDILGMNESKNRIATQQDIDKLLA